MCVLEILFSCLRHIVNNQFLMHIEFEPMLPFEAWYLIKKINKKKSILVTFEKGYCILFIYIYICNIYIIAMLHVNVL